MPTRGKLSVANYYAGTSGLVLPVPNKTYYPEEFRDKSRLCYYASLFNSIEVNSSFYKIPLPKTIGKWVEDVTNGFRFTFKLWRGITHEKDLVFSPADITRFIEAIGAAGSRKGCLLVQFPPSAKVNLMPRLEKLTGYLKQGDPDGTWKIAIEFRHASWYTDRLLQFAERNSLCIVLQDIPASATPLEYALGDTIYLRFHGPGGKYSGSYPDDVLQEYSTYIYEWQEEGKTVYAYFNNTMGDAVKNLIALNQMVVRL